MRGIFITIEGGEGAGKTTALAQLKEKLTEHDYPVVTTREPGGIAIAEKIRHVILDPEHTKMDSRTEALLYAAARRQHLVEFVLPALEAGNIVLCDRFVDSSLAYQGYARGIAMDEIWAINQFAVDACMPELTLLFDLKPEVGLQRIATDQRREKNRLDLEKKPFHDCVYQAYHILRDRFPNRIVTIDAEQSMEKVVNEAYNRIMAYLDK